MILPVGSFLDCDCGVPQPAARTRARNGDGVADEYCLQIYVIYWHSYIFRTFPGFKDDQRCFMLQELGRWCLSHLAFIFLGSEVKYFMLGCISDVLAKVMSHFYPHRFYADEPCQPRSRPSSRVRSSGLHAEHGGPLGLLPQLFGGFRGKIAGVVLLNIPSSLPFWIVPLTHDSPLIMSKPWLIPMIHQL